MLCEMVSDCFLTQLVLASTRKDSILDIVLINTPDNIFQLLYVIISLVPIMMPSGLMLRSLKLLHLDICTIIKD